MPPSLLANRGAVGDRPESKILFWSVPNTVRNSGPPNLTLAIHGARPDSKGVFPLELHRESGIPFPRPVIRTLDEATGKVRATVRDVAIIV